MRSHWCSVEMAIFVLIMGTCVTRVVLADDQPLGIFDHHADVGAVKNPGAVAFDADRQEYTITASGENMWNDHDEFHFIWKQLKGDFIVQARAHFLTEGGQPHKKFGWIARSSLDPNSAHVNVSIHGDGRTSLLWRRTAGAKTEEKLSKVQAADVFQLERKGNTYTMSVARFGEPFVTEQIADVDLGDNPYVGLFVCAHNPDDIHKVLFDNVRIIVPAKENFVPYRDYIGSNLEILDVDTGHREIVYHTGENLEAPNWTPDGKSLLCNGRGKLFRFDLVAKTLSPIDTGACTRLNNDHVISPDGRLIGISNNNREDGNKSIVFTLPAAGGTPQRITPQGHSYLHGWSPDGKFLLFTGQRDGNFDVYRIPAAGGDEVRLTDSAALDDGPQYSPEGQTIYFCSTRTGTMQLWRMNADGSAAKQLTDDKFNNWFPHPSPDGKSLVFISFPPETDPTDHSYYRRVSLRLMPAVGGDAKTIAYLYGGQGTINVPSWSPDGKKLAFVSNSAEFGN